MAWDIEFHNAFAQEVDQMAPAVRIELMAHVQLLEQFGPELGRPRCDTLNGSDFANMKELRLNANNGVWRVAFAFDPNRTAILLVAGDKRGSNEKRFYKALIRTADARFKQHLDSLALG